MATAQGFETAAAEMKHREPQTPIERVLKVYSWANSAQVLDIVIDNWEVLRHAGLLEDAFLDAWSTHKGGVPNWTMPFCRSVFSLLNHAKLLRAGDPLPEGESFTVYRGVAGIGARARRIRGFSWTGDERIARDFAELRAQRYELPNPSVYRAVIRRQHVLAYINAKGRNEQEFLVWPTYLSQIKRIV